MPKGRKRERDDIEIEPDEAPTGINPYQVLGLDKDATQDDVKKAYRKAALKHHPDKAAPEDKDTAHTKFQEIAFAFAILSDERRRKRYDTTGRTEESVGLEDDDFDWVEFFRTQFVDVVTTEKIDAFSQEYKGSDEEREAVLEAYTKYKGDMNKLYEVVMMSDMLEDEDRYRKIIDSAISSRDVESYKKYAEESESARQKRFDKERKTRAKQAKEAEHTVEELKEGASKKKSKKSNGDGDLGDLAALIQQRQKGRAENFFDNLEAKYGGGGSKGSEPSEEAFAANRKSKKSKR